MLEVMQMDSAHHRVALDSLFDHGAHHGDGYWALTVWETDSEFIGGGV
jgi:hypothetical protein